MALRSVPQTGMDELVMKDDRIEKILVTRQSLKDAFDRARVEYQEADERAKAAIADLELVEGAVRIGPFRITKTFIPARTVEAFETKASNRVRISRLDA